MQLHGRQIGLDQPIFLIAGPCVIESEELQLRTAERLKAIADKLGILFFFKSSFDKANRSSDKSFRGPGIDEGLKILAKVRSEIGVPVLTDVHDIPQIKPVAEVVDVLQTPAFLARQTDFIQAVAACGRPGDMK
jgi:2-dehydro-3-deoxyphosphooctonate aldolase (KDO 8-P synthase)